MQRLLLLTVSVIFFSSSSPAQLKSIPKNYFDWPVNKGNPGIAANFGELRSNHWHMGLDIRTNQTENLPVYAAAAGYISRISVEPFGYGKAIYIQHPNGLVTVYGHLNKFFDELNNFVEAQQYQRQSWPIALEFTKNQFPVSKGQLIAYSGNTGGSAGPHTHFEIRDGNSNRCINPLFFTLPLPDAVPPLFSKLAMYNREITVTEQTPQFFSVKKTKTGYVPAGSLIKTGSRKVSFAVTAFDRVSKSVNPNGIYSAKLFFDEKNLVEFDLDSMDYNETDYVNAHIDYGLRRGGGAYVQHLSQLPGDHGVAYKKNENGGIIFLNDDSIHNIRIEIYDVQGNKSTLDFKLQFSNELVRANLRPPTARTFIPNQINVFDQPNFSAYTDDKAMYDTAYIDFNVNNDPVKDAISSAFQLGDPDIPIHNRINIRIRPNIAIPDALKEKIVIRIKNNGGSSYRKASWQKDGLSAVFGDFGSYQAFIDTIPPTINSLGNGDTTDLSASKSIIFYPSDNTGVRSFRAELDGQWLMFTNDKGRAYIYKFDARCPYGVHHIKVKVEDIVGNTIEKEWWFKRNPYTPPKKKKVTVKKKSKK